MSTGTSYCDYEMARFTGSYITQCTSSATDEKKCAGYAYEALTRTRLHEMGWSDVLGETGARPDELANGIDHLDKLETLGKSAKDLKYSAGFTGNKALQHGSSSAKLVIGKGIGAS